jgi:hypothetical protein
MPLQPNSASRARAEALFEHAKKQKPIATAEYRAAQEAALERMHELRQLRLARETELAARRDR